MGKLSTWFGNFGDIENIQIHADKNTAFIQFSSPDEAKAAIDSGRGVLGFPEIEVLWAHYNRPDYERKKRLAGINFENSPPNKYHRRMQKNIMNSFGSYNQHNSKDSGILPPRPVRNQSKITFASDDTSDKSSKRSSPMKKTTVIGVSNASLTRLKDLLDKASRNVVNMKSQIEETMKLIEQLKDKSSKQAVDLRGKLMKTLHKFTKTYQTLLLNEKKATLTYKNELDKMLKKKKMQSKATKILNADPKKCQKDFWIEIWIYIEKSARKDQRQ
eukprot:UN02433